MAQHNSPALIVIGGHEYASLQIHNGVRSSSFRCSLIPSEAGGARHVICRPENAAGVLPRADLKSLASTNHSLMPQGFEAAMTPEDLADLMAFVQNPTAAR